MKYKNIKSVAHNLGHSFLSDTNATGERSSWTIVPELLFAEAARRQEPEVRIDFLTGEISPAALAIPEVKRSVEHYGRWLPALLESQSIEATSVVAAALTIRFDYSRTRRTQYHPVREIQEFSCLVELRDDRGVVHRAEPDHWWAV